MIIQNKQEVRILREGGKRLALVRNKILEFVAPGVSTAEIDDYAHRLITAQGDRPAFLDYQPEGAPRPFPASVCVSINDVVVHGIPTENPQILKEGDVVTVDFGLIHEGLVTDSAETVAVGNVAPREKELIDTAREALAAAIGAVRAGVRTGSIGAAIERVVRKHDFGIPRELGGHGVGRRVHEDPTILNFGSPGRGDILEEGMVIAIEPIITMGGGNVIFEDDGYTVRTEDGSKAAHSEHTVIVTKESAEILTR